MKRSSRGGAFDLEALRAALSDRRTHISMGLVQKVEVLTSNAKARALVLVYPEKYEVVAEVCNVAQIPQVNDLVLVGFVNADEVFILQRLSSKEDKFPPQSKDGHLVNEAISGKKAYLNSDEAILLQKPNLTGIDTADEPLVLGNVLVELMTEVIGKFDALLDKLIAGPIGMGNLGSPVPTYPQLITDLTAMKAEVAEIQATYLDTAATNIVSQLSFTER